MDMDSEYQYNDHINTLFGIEIADSSDGLKSEYLHEYANATYYKTEHSNAALANIAKYNMTDYNIRQEFMNTRHIAGFCSTKDCREKLKQSHVACEYNCAECFAKKMYDLHTSKVSKISIKINSIGSGDTIPKKICIRFNRGNLLIYDKNKKLLLNIPEECFSFNLINALPVINVDASLLDENGNAWASVIFASYMGNMLCKSVWEGKECMESGTTNYRESNQKNIGYIFEQEYCYTCAKNRHSVMKDNILLQSKIINVTNERIVQCNSMCKHAKENIMLKDKIAKISKQLNALSQQ